MAQCTITGYIKDLTGTAIENATIEAKLLDEIEVNTTLRVVQKRVSAVTDSNGLFTLSLLQAAAVIISIRYPDGNLGEIRKEYSATVPSTSTADFNNVI